MRFHMSHNHQTGDVLFTIKSNTVNISLTNKFPGLILYGNCQILLSKLNTLCSSMRNLKLVLSQEQ